MLRIEKIQNGFILYLPEGVGLNSPEAMSEALFMAKKKIEDSENLGFEPFSSLRPNVAPQIFYEVNAIYFKDEIDLLAGLQYLLVK